jgi:hypothetical protein
MKNTEKMIFIIIKNAAQQLIISVIELNFEWQVIVFLI